MNLIDCSAEDIHGETRGKIDPHYVHCIAPRESERPEFENHRARVQPRNRCDYGSTARRSGTRARIYYKQLGELCVPGKIRASTVFPIVEAFQDKDELWHVRTEPDGFEPGNLRSVKQC